MVAPTSHTLDPPLPGTAGCGTRVHTFPDALATSIAADPFHDLLVVLVLDLLRFVSHRTSSHAAQGTGCPGASVGKPKF